MPNTKKGKRNKSENYFNVIYKWAHLSTTMRCAFILDSATVAYQAVRRSVTQIVILHLHEAQWLDLHGQPTAARLVHEIWRHWAPSPTTSFTHSDFLQRIMPHLASLRSNSNKGQRVHFECIQ
ncbi:hypothetical protein TRVL_09750 [Trypanosoma vivax]|nr:hypothetical protein TRVL_09750 [Trypanosoma vivax]